MISLYLKVILGFQDNNTFILLFPFLFVFSHLFPILSFYANIFLFLHLYLLRLDDRIALLGAIVLFTLVFFIVLLFIFAVDCLILFVFYILGLKRKRKGGG